MTQYWCKKCKKVEYGYPQPANGRPVKLTCGAELSPEKQEEVRVKQMRFYYLLPDGNTILKAHPQEIIIADPSS